MNMRRETGVLLALGAAALVLSFVGCRDRFTCNHSDRVGHFTQGFVPALVAREVLLRKTPLRRGGWMFFLVTCVCLAASAFYELVEWWVAAATGTAADAFLGTQGDPWDTQWDMCWALVGAVAAQLLLSRVQDRQMQAVASRAG
jgi:putative membrane protein